MEKAKAELGHNVSVGQNGIIPNPEKRLLDQVRQVIRLKHYSIRTEQAYLNWVTRIRRANLKRATAPIPFALPRQSLSLPQHLKA